MYFVELVNFRTQPYPIGPTVREVDPHLTLNGNTIYRWTFLQKGGLYHPKTQYTFPIRWCCCAFPFSPAFSCLFHSSSFSNHINNCPSEGKVWSHFPHLLHLLLLLVARTHSSPKPIFGFLDKGKNQPTSSLCFCVERTQKDPHCNHTCIFIHFLVGFLFRVWDLGVFESFELKLEKKVWKANWGKYKL